MKISAVLAVLGFVLVGCAPTGVSEADSAKVKQEFSRENYEKAMIESGKGAELEAEKKKEAEFLKGGADHDAGQH